MRDSDPMLNRRFDTGKPLRSMWMQKKHLLPSLHGNRMLKGTM